MENRRAFLHIPEGKMTKHNNLEQIKDLLKDTITQQLEKMGEKEDLTVEDFRAQVYVKDNEIMYFLDVEYTMHEKASDIVPFIFTM